jgi:hypothetical protein
MRESGVVRLYQDDITINHKRAGGVNAIPE